MSVDPHEFEPARSASDPYCGVCGLPQRNLYKHPLIFDVLRDPDMVGTSEYRAVHEAITDQLDGLGAYKEEQLPDVYVEASLDAFIEVCTAIKADLAARRKQVPQTH